MVNAASFVMWVTERLRELGNCVHRKKPVAFTSLPGGPSGSPRQFVHALSGAATLKKTANSTEYLSHPEVRPEEFYAEYFAMYRIRYGAIDVLIELPGVGPFDSIMRNARRYDIAGFNVSIYVASLEDIIRSKETAGRSKDFAVLPALYEAANHLAQHPDDYALSVDALDVQAAPKGFEN